MARITTNGAAGSDVWSREAERVRALAAQAGRPLDEDALLLLDVYELRALRDGLERACARQESHWALLRRLPVFGSALIRKGAGAGEPDRDRARRQGTAKMKNILLATSARSGAYRRIGRWSLIALLLVAGLISGVQRHAVASHSSASAAGAGCTTASRAKPLTPLATFRAIALPAGTATGVPVYAAFPAGFTFKHVHGGPTYVYVIAGDLEITDAQGTITYCAGSFFSEPPGHVHTLHVVQPSEVFILQFLPPGADGTIAVK